MYTYTHMRVYENMRPGKVTVHDLGLWGSQGSRAGMPIGSERCIVELIGWLWLWGFEEWFGALALGLPGMHGSRLDSSIDESESWKLINKSIFLVK